MTMTSKPSGRPADLKRYPIHLRTLVVMEVAAGDGIRAVARKHGIPPMTVHSWVAAAKSQNAKGPENRA